MGDEKRCCDQCDTESKRLREKYAECADAWADEYYERTHLQCENQRMRAEIERLRKGIENLLGESD